MKDLLSKTFSQFQAGLGAHKLLCRGKYEATNKHSMRI